MAQKFKSQTLKIHTKIVFEYAILPQSSITKFRCHLWYKKMILIGNLRYANHTRFCSGKFHQNPYLVHKNNCTLLSNNWYFNFIINRNYYQIAVYTNTNTNLVHALSMIFCLGIFSHGNRKWNRNSISHQKNFTTTKQIADLQKRN